jgi:hypothetical protein
MFRLEKLITIIADNTLLVEPGSMGQDVHGEMSMGRIAIGRDVIGRDIMERVVMDELSWLPY